MSSYKVSSERELYALTSQAQAISTMSLRYWTVRDHMVMDFANENSKDYGYENWQDAFTQLRRIYDYHG